MRLRHLPALLAGMLFGSSLSLAAFAADSDQWTLPVQTTKLDNGLTVIVCEDHSSPTVGVSPEQVRAVSKKYFAPENQSVVVVGDPKAVGEQLKPFGEFTVTDR